ncbi:2TM domain-containing protein [Winogradskyella sp. A3E31]|uniref:2TM domain-containing protein n=1 Tax=Winogradskyella sp. A3E31 TaxID=3349637 RepID=UPI00398B2D97
MTDKEKEEFFYIEAQKKVHKLRWFYIHLAGYVVVLGLVIWNLIIIEDTAYTDSILAINYSTIFIWGFFIVFHAINTFKERLFFSKKWEAKKLEEFLGKKNKTWE